MDFENWALLGWGFTAILAVANFYSNRELKLAKDEAQKAWGFYNQVLEELRMLEDRYCDLKSSSKSDLRKLQRIVTDISTDKNKKKISKVKNPVLDDPLNEYYISEKDKYNDHIDDVFNNDYSFGSSSPSYRSDSSDYSGCSGSSSSSSSYDSGGSCGGSDSGD